MMSVEFGEESAMGCIVSRVVSVVRDGVGVKGERLKWGACRWVAYL